MIAVSVHHFPLIIQGSEVQGFHKLVLTMLPTVQLVFQLSLKLRAKIISALMSVKYFRIYSLIMFANLNLISASVLVHYCCLICLWLVQSPCNLVWVTVFLKFTCTHCTSSVVCGREIKDNQLATHDQLVTVVGTSGHTVLFVFISFLTLFWGKWNVFTV